MFRAKTNRKLVLKSPRCVHFNANLAQIVAKLNLPVQRYHHDHEACSESSASRHQSQTSQHTVTGHWSGQSTGQSVSEIISQVMVSEHTDPLTPHTHIPDHRCHIWTRCGLDGHHIGQIYYFLIIVNSAKHMS